MADIAFGSVFLFIGFTVCAIAAIRRPRGPRIFAWLGIWSALYGAVQLTQGDAVVAALPPWLPARAAHQPMLLLIWVVAPLCFAEWTAGALRRVMYAVVCGGFAMAVADLFFFGGRSDPALMRAVNVLGGSTLAILTIVLAVPSLARRNLVLPDRKVLAAGALIFTLEALYNSLSHLLGLNRSRVFDHLGFGVLLFAFGYVALRLVLENERRLQSVEKELAIAREIQRSILPAGIPVLRDMSIGAAYVPMTEVAGDFYEFIPVDPRRAGLLVADVCGHGVPAALIASMLKIAVDMVSPCAADPGAVLRGLNRLLYPSLRGRPVTAAYLWLDTGNRCALYSAAGHPALLRWRRDRLEAIESNGLLFGVRADFAGYPVCAIPIVSGDRFLLYTDGVTEAENAAGECFGERRLEQVLRAGRADSAAALSDRLLAELRRWRPASCPQQDDITLLVIDACS